LTTANFSKLQKFLPADLRIDAEEEFANSLKAISDGAQSPASLTVRLSVPPLSVRDKAVVGNVCLEYVAPGSNIVQK
jgi:hypothetical protein